MVNTSEDKFVTYYTHHFTIKNLPVFAGCTLAGLVLIPAAVFFWHEAFTVHQAMVVPALLVSMLVFGFGYAGYDFGVQYTRIKHEKRVLE